MNALTMQNQEIESFTPTSQQEWRNWLQENHQVRQSVWLIYGKKKFNKPSISWEQAVEEALCFGWIDSTRRSLDEETFSQFFCKRKSGSVWSKINKTKVAWLIEEGLMTQAGFDSIAIAQQNGSWSILDEVEELTVPADLELALAGDAVALAFFTGLSKSVKKAILQWLVLARRAETREKRISEIVSHAAQQLRPRQFR
jgi:uncharacterized protein YdeI (YjbR/CyaY-like superfamily)